MKIALIGSAPSSIRLAPYADPEYQIWACSPGTYPIIPRCNKFFELHRPEFGKVGKPETQVPWFTPEYVAWMKLQACVVMTETHPDFPNSVRLPREYLQEVYGNYFFTSSLSWMLAMAIEEILADRKTRTEAKEDAIGLWGVDMSHTTEYSSQRAGCHYFVQLANQLDITIVVPPESDLLRPPVLYGVVEYDHHHIKNTVRRKEIEQRLAAAEAQLEQAKMQVSFYKGALDDIDYQLNTWHENLVGRAVQLKELFKPKEQTGEYDIEPGKVTWVDKEYKEERVDLGEIEPLVGWPESTYMTPKVDENGTDTKTAEESLPLGIYESPEGKYTIGPGGPIALDAVFKDGKSVAEYAKWQAYAPESSWRG